MIHRKYFLHHCFIAEDSYYEVRHGLGEYPGLVVVRAKMARNDSSFYATGVGKSSDIPLMKCSKAWLQLILFAILILQ